jgi:hypothetical protein
MTMNGSNPSPTLTLNLINDEQGDEAAVAAALDAMPCFAGVDAKVTAMHCNLDT